MAEDRLGDVPEGSIFNTEQYKSVKERYQSKISNAKLSDKEKEEIDKLLAVPDARPALFDGTLEAWLLRISLWGKIKITHKNPEARMNVTMNDDMFLNYVDDKQRNETYGQWTIEEVQINKIRFYRKYVGITGKEVTEEIIVDIDLRPDLKERMKKAKRKNSWLGKLGF